MRILITGANGLVGQGVLQECLRDPAVTQVVALGRHASGQSHAKLSELLCADFSKLGPIEEHLHPFDACLYCAGAAPLGTREAEYRHVTLELTTHVAQTLGRLNPDISFLYVSGAHSDPASRLMQMRIKGETERALAALPLRTVMLRAGGIQPVAGVRSPHPAMAAMYALTGPFMGLGVRLLPQVMTTTQRVGRAMLALLRQDDPPAVIENAEINRLGQTQDS
ncbi:MAG: NAD-dependent epimerase/dehydratase family protein [Pseudoxanthomonas sp.]